jgi:hypothetical protein
MPLASTLYTCTRGREGGVRTDGLSVDIGPGADYLANKPRATSVVSFSFGGTTCDGLPRSKSAIILERTNLLN